MFYYKSQWAPKMQIITIYSKGTSHKIVINHLYLAYLFFVWLQLKSRPIRNYASIYCLVIKKYRYIAIYSPMSIICSEVIENHIFTHIYMWNHVRRQWEKSKQNKGNINMFRFMYIQNTYMPHIVLCTAVGRIVLRTFQSIEFSNQ